MLINFKIENNILIADFPENIAITLHIAKQMVEERLAFQQGIDFPVLIYLNGVKYISSEARIYFKNQGLNGIKAAAFIITNPVENMILKFCFSFETPSIPSKTFFKNKKTEAMHWLNQFITT